MNSEKRDVKFPIKRKLFLLSIAVAVPFFILLVYLLGSMIQYTKTYDKIVNNMTVANDYNLNFKEEMDESLYKLVVGYVTFDNISENETLKDPYLLINELREAFMDLKDITMETESRMWLETLLRNLDTLETIIWLIEDERTDEAVTMVVTLSNFFRLALSRGREFISIRDEESHIRSYLEIQEVRYRDILEYDIQIDKVLYDYQILKLTLQPLVENALYHGIKHKRTKGHISIYGEKEGEEIRLTVRDDGAGMEVKELEQLRDEIQRPCEETEKGFGLANVNERIRMYFGAGYGMTIESGKNKGTVVEIRIPAVKTPGGK